MHDLQLLIFNQGFRFQYSVCNGCHNLNILGNIVIITINLLKFVYQKILYLKIMVIYKKILPKFSRQFFYFLRFAICKMVDSECIRSIYKSVKVSIRAVMKNPEIFKFVPIHLKTKTMCKTQQMCDKASLEKKWNIFVSYWLLQKAAIVW